MYLEVDWLINVWTLHSKVECRSGLSAQFLAHFGGALLDHTLSIDAEDGITYTYTCFHSGPSLVGIGDDDCVAALLNEGADATIFAGGHGLEVRLIFLAVEFAVWIEFGEHGFHASGQSFSPVNGIYILSLQGRDGGSQDLHILLCVEVQVLHFLFVAIVRRLCLSLRGAGKAECQACDEANEAQHLFLHVLNIKKFGQISRFFFEYPKNDCVFCFFSGNLWEKWAKCLIFAAINSIYIVRCVPF